MERRIVVGDFYDALSQPVPPCTLGGFLPQRVKGPYTLAAGDFSSDDDNSEDDSDDESPAAGVFLRLYFIVVLARERCRRVSSYVFVSDSTT